ncbi:TIGR00725 family protein [Breoghania sp.]|uniref:TIGR00725 family protein n=1 Tax=Breoghania sp. TaxID=2065378 RepID=UPI0029C9B816|nr:TIGR00725 family protein [Breoghania sp.]
MATRLYGVDGARIFSASGELDPWGWCWNSGVAMPESVREVDAKTALKCIGESGKARRIPVGVIGPREAATAQLEAAEALGTALGELGLTVMCGGKTGVMEAVSRGCLKAGGLTIGLVPDHSWRDANDYIALPIATGLSEARNMIIAKSCQVLVAVGNSYGTLSEVAYGLHFSKPVIGLEGAANVDGVQHAASVDEAVELVAEHMLQSAKLS